MSRLGEGEGDIGKRVCLVSAGPRKTVKFFRTRVWGKSWVSILDTEEEKEQEGKAEGQEVRKIHL